MIGNGAELLSQAILKCEVCGDPRHPLASLCSRCKKIVNRVEIRAHRSASKLRRTAALRRAWDPALRCFRCEYTGIRLEERHPHPAHLVFDHAGADDQGEVRV